MCTCVFVCLMRVRAWARYEPGFFCEFSRLFYFRGTTFASWEFERRASLSGSGIGYLDTMKCIVEIPRYRGLTCKSDVHAKVKKSLSLLCLRTGQYGGTFQKHVLAKTFAPHPSLCLLIDRERKKMSIRSNITGSAFASRYKYFKWGSGADVGNFAGDRRSPTFMRI